MQRCKNNTIKKTIKIVFINKIQEWPKAFYHLLIHQVLEIN